MSEQAESRRISYILPVRRISSADSDGLGSYLRWLAQVAEVIVVDGSEQAVFDSNGRSWGSVVHVPPCSDLQVTNGKVRGVLTGLKLASHDCVVIADDDVRYDRNALDRVVHLLDQAEVVRPQNYFSPSPWHARWDTARSLLNRVSGGDWPGTLAVRRSCLSEGYDGNCLFENLELVRTVRAGGGRELVAFDVFVRRLPPTTRHFLSQRVRQAYDELARPGRLVAQLSLLPAFIYLVTHRRRAVGSLAIVSVLLAEAGRRRGNGRTIWTVGASFAAPLWVSERMVCIWLALFARLLFGGVRYHGARISRPATPARELRARLGGRAKADS